MWGAGEGVGDEVGAAWTKAVVSGHTGDPSTSPRAAGSLGRAHIQGVTW